MNILVLNAGSSSQKSCLYSLNPNNLPLNPPQPLWEGYIDWTHHEGMAELKVKTASGVVLTRELAVEGEGEKRQSVIASLLSTLWEGETQVIDSPQAIQVVGHRVVHGGAEYQASTRITPEVKNAIARLARFAPVHNPANLQGIEAIEAILGASIPQIAVFDTAFHATLPAAASVYPGDYDWLKQGIRRYGFHGISHQYCATRAAQLLGRNLDELRLITCHLGNGCSLAAIRNGESIDTTMGFTPLEGLMMGSRSGSVDPGILIHLLRQGNCTADQLDVLLNRRSGLLGISGVSADFRQVMAAIASGHERAQLALEIYVHRLRSLIGSMLASLRGLDALIFTAGVGENAANVRAATCEAFEFLGLKLDAEKNLAAKGDCDIAANESRIRVLVIHTEEDWAIAQSCITVLNHS